MSEYMDVGVSRIMATISVSGIQHLRLTGASYTRYPPNTHMFFVYIAD